MRNTVGFTWHPDTEEFFFNMIERDLIGDNRYMLDRTKFPKQINAKLTIL